MANEEMSNSKVIWHKYFRSQILATGIDERTPDEERLLCPYVASHRCYPFCHLLDSPQTGGKYLMTSKLRFTEVHCMLKIIIKKFDTICLIIDMKNKVMSLSYLFVGSQMQFAVDVSTCCPVAEVEIRATLAELYATETTHIEKSGSFEYRATFSHRGEAVLGNNLRQWNTSEQIDQVKLLKGPR